MQNKSKSIVLTDKRTVFDSLKMSGRRDLLCFFQRLLSSRDLREFSQSIISKVKKKFSTFQSLKIKKKNSYPSIFTKMNFLTTRYKKKLWYPFKSSNAQCQLMISEKTRTLIILLQLSSPQSCMTHHTNQSNFTKTICQISMKFLNGKLAKPSLLIIKTRVLLFKVKCLLQEVLGSLFAIISLPKIFLTLSSWLIAYQIVLQCEVDNLQFQRNKERLSLTR